MGNGRCYKLINSRRGKQIDFAREIFLVIGIFTMTNNRNKRLCKLLRKLTTGPISALKGFIQGHNPIKMRDCI